MILRGRIIKGIGGFYYVDAAGVLYECRARGLFRKQGITPLVGDMADIELISEEDRTAYLVDIADRKSELIRPAVANVDQVMVIFACTHPTPNLGLIDRYLINMELQEVETVLVISKADLVSGDEAINDKDTNDKDTDDNEADRLRDIYSKAGYRVIVLSNTTGEGLDEIKELLKGKMTVLSGPSGVGKSSLINNLAPHYEGETGDISKKLGKGKNTTRHTEIIEIEDMEDSFIIDTPGYSSIQLLVEEEDDIRLYMREFEDLNGKCKFGGCVHMAEPGCLVKEAVSEGRISQERYNSYTDIYNEIKDRRKW